MNGRYLMDEEGENIALRSFLRLYGGYSDAIAISTMREHMELSGWDGCWPDWVSTAKKGETLTKAGAQLWIRHLIALEKRPVSIHPKASVTMLNRIIAELESGAGPDRKIDALIDLWRKRGVCGHPDSVRRYTAVRDFALKLFPRQPGSQLIIERTGEAGQVIQCGVIEQHYNVWYEAHDLWPPARQLCLIALKAQRDLIAREN
jgi:hypothetical protein